MRSNSHCAWLGKRTKDCNEADSQHNSDLFWFTGKWNLLPHIRFGGWVKALEAAGFQGQVHTRWTDEQLLDALRLYAINHPSKPIAVHNRRLADMARTRFGSRPFLPWAWLEYWTKGPKSLRTLATQALSFSLESGSLCLRKAGGERLKAGGKTERNDWRSVSSSYQVLNGSPFLERTPLGPVSEDGPFFRSNSPRASAALR